MSTRTLLCILALIMVQCPSSVAAQSATAHPRSVEAQSATAHYRVSAQSAPVFPNDRWLISAEIDPDEGATTGLVVLQIFITSAVIVRDVVGGSCTQAANERDGSLDNLVCTFVDRSEPASVTVSLRPMYVVTDPIAAACGYPMDVSAPFSLHENGVELAYQARVWAPYRPGYCAYLPVIARDEGR
jgi:hypothetical protein